MKKDVVIVGAGPAGLRAAEVLAKAGKDVVVLEQKKIIGHKVCAGGLTLKDIELGIPKSLFQRFFKKALMHCKNDCVEFKMKKPFIATVDRKDLGKWMAKQARKAGANVETETPVKSIGKDFVQAKDKKVYFDYLIGADGANSIVRRHLKIPSKKVISAFQYIVPKKYKNLEVFYDGDKFGPGYAWIFPYAKTTSIGCGVDLSQKILKPSTVMNNFKKWYNQNKFSMKNEEFQAHTINFDYRGFQFNKKFLIGDAGGFASGFTGEGIAYAMLSGADVAKKIINPKYSCPNIKKVLRVKAIEESVVGMLEINKTAINLGFAFFVSLIQSNWLKNTLAEKA